MAVSQPFLLAALDTRATLTKALIVLGGSALIALGAQVSVPMFPVPMTLQTLAILLVGLTAGSRLGAATVLAYLAEGGMGLPVFAGGNAGMAALMGPTAGYLWGFVGMAWLAGKAVEWGIARDGLTTAISGVVVSALLYVPGVLWLDAATGLDLLGALKAGMLPFVPGDVVKAVMAALIVVGAQAAMEARKR